MRKSVRSLGPLVGRFQMERDDSAEHVASQAKVVAGRISNSEGSCWIAGWCEQKAKDGSQNTLASYPSVVDELEKPEEVER